MSSPAASRPLSLRPFLAADGVLLATACLIAWRTPDALAGWPLFGVVFCAGLGAVLMILPFVINEVRQREIELAERQRELAEIVGTSNANTSRWGAQWTAAATGLEDAATLASRSLAAAERLPTMVEQQIAALEERLARANAEARMREERAAEQECRLAANEQAFAARAEALLPRLEQAAAGAAQLERASAELARVEGALRERQAGVEASRASLAALVEESNATRVALQQAWSDISAKVEASALLATSNAQARFDEFTTSLTERRAALETSLAGFARELERLKTAAAEIELPKQPETSATRVASAAVIEVVTASPSLGVSTKSMRLPLACDSSLGVPPEPIMDPFHVPTDGYSALAEAMDAARSA